MTMLDVRPLRDGLPFGVRVRDVTRDNVGDPQMREGINALFTGHDMILF